MEDPEGLVRVCETVGITPARICQLLTAMIEAILALRCAVQVNDDFQTGLARPGDGLIQIGCRTLSERAPGLELRPVADRNTDSVDTVIDHPLKIAVVDKVVPVVLEHASGLIRVHTGDDIELAALGLDSLLEKGRREPTLEGEP